MTGSDSQRLLQSTASMVELACQSPQEFGRALMRLANITLGDFPGYLFKLQYLDSRGRIRVESRFVTPRIQQILSRFSAELGHRDVRDVVLPLKENPLIEKSILSFREFSVDDPDRIKNYYEGYFAGVDRRDLGRLVLQEMGIRELLFFPVRPDEAPFGVLSVSCPEVPSREVRGYWRTAASVLTGIYRSRRNETGCALLAGFFDASPEAALMVDAEGEIINVNKRALALLGFASTEELRRRIGTLFSRPADQNDPEEESSGRIIYIRDVHGNSLALSAVSRRFGLPSGEPAGRLLYISSTGPKNRPEPILSRRQREIARLIASGKSTKEIAAGLGLSIHTVNYHRGRIRRKLIEYGGDLNTALARLFPFSER